MDHNTEQNELHIKQVFSDEDAAKTAAADAVAEDLSFTKKTITFGDPLPELTDLHSRYVLDEDYAERKAAQNPGFVPEAAAPVTETVDFDLRSTASLPETEPFSPAAPVPTPEAPAYPPEMPAPATLPPRPAATAPGPRAARTPRKSAAGQRSPVQTLLDLLHTLRRRPQKGVDHNILYSGEYISEAARQIGKELVILLVVAALICVGFQCKNVVMDFLSNNAYGSMYSSSTYADAVQCTVPESIFDVPPAYAAANLLCSAAGVSLPDADAIPNTEDTVFPSALKQYLSHAFSEDSIHIKTNLTNLDLLMEIHESLRQEKPVLVLISDLADPVENRFALQYVAVTGMDTETDTITVMHPTAGKKTYSFSGFIEATRFDNFADMPMGIQLGLTFGSWNRNTAIFVKE